MPKLLADENFNKQIIQGLLRRQPDLDIVRVQDVELGGQDDPIVLEWAAQENRVVLTHDEATMAPYANERLRTSQLMPGMLIVLWDAPVGAAIEGILLMLGASLPNEWTEQVRYLSL